MKEKTAVIGALRFTASALASRRGLELRVGGNTACTDGKVIILPVLPEDDETARVLAAGYVDHEAAHVKWTDFTVNNSQWQNLLEDVRIERLQGERFPGAKINLGKLLKKVVERGGFAVPATDDHIGRLMLWAAARERRLLLQQDALLEREALVEGECRKTLGKEFCDAFVGLADTLRDCKTTGDVAELAEKIRQLIKNSSEPPPSPDGSDSDGSGSDSSGSDGSDSGGSGSDGSDSDGSDSDGSDSDGASSGAGGSGSDGSDSDGSDGSDGASSGSDGAGSDGADSDGAGSDGASSGSDGAGSDGADSDGAGSDGSDSDGAGSDGASSGSGGSGASRTRKALRELADAEEPENAPEMGQEIKKILEGLSNQMDDPSTPLVAGEEKASPAPSDVAWQALGGTEALRQAVLKTGRMAGQLAGLLQSMRLMPSFPRQVGNRVDPRSCHLIAVRTPDTRVFKSRSERIAVNTAVTLLIDRSGSMRGRITNAMAAAYAVAVALDRIPGVRTSIAVFPGVIENDNGVTPIKSFEEKAHMTPFLNVMWASGGTPIGPSLMWAGMKLTHMRGEERRKIAILFTDGRPDSEQTAKDAVQKLKDYGIEVYAVILQPDYHYRVQWIDEKSFRELDKIESLPKVLFELLRQTLLKP